MSRKSDAESFSARLALLSLVLCAINIDPIEGFAPWKLTASEVRNSALSKQDVLRAYGSFEGFDQPQPLFQGWVEQLEVTPPSPESKNKFVEDKEMKEIEGKNKELKVVAENDIMSEAQLASFPEMELSFDISFAENDIITEAEVQQEEIVSISESVVETEVEVQETIKDQAQANGVDELKQKSLLDVKSRYDFAARQARGFAPTKTDSNKAKGFVSTKIDFNKGKGFANKKTDTNKAKDFASRKDDTNKANGFTPTKTITVKAKGFTTTETDSEKASEAEDNNSEIKENIVELPEATKEDVVSLAEVTKEENDVKLPEATEEEEKEDSAVKIPKVFSSLESESLDYVIPLVARDIERENRIREQAAESRQRSLLKARLTMETRARDKAVAKAKAEKEASSEFKHRSLLEAKLQFDAITRKLEMEKVKAEAKAKAEAIDEFNHRSLLEAKIQFDAAVRQLELEKNRAKAEAIDEMKHRSLLEAKLQFDAVAKQTEMEKAAAEAKAKAEAVDELTHRTLLEAKLLFDATTRRVEIEKAAAEANAKTEAIDEMKHRSLLEAKLQFDAATRQIEMERAAAEAEAKIEAMSELNHRSLLKAKLQFDAVAKQMEMKKAAAEAKAEAESIAEMKQRSLFEAKLQFDAIVRQMEMRKAAAEAKAKAKAEAKAEAELNHRSLLEAKLQFDAAARQLEMEKAAAEAKAKAKAEVEAGAELHHRSLLEAKLHFDAAANHKKRDKAAVEAKAKAEARAEADDELYHRALLEAKLHFDDAAKQIELEKSAAEIKAKADSFVEMKQRSLLEAKLQYDAAAKQKELERAAAEAKAAAEAMVEFKQRSLLETKLQFDAAARQFKAAVFLPSNAEIEETNIDNASEVEYVFDSILAGKSQSIQGEEPVLNDSVDVDDSASIDSETVLSINPNENDINLETEGKVDVELIEAGLQSDGDEVSAGLAIESNDSDLLVVSTSLQVEPQSPPIIVEEDFKENKGAEIEEVPVSELIKTILSNEKNDEEKENAIEMMASKANYAEPLFSSVIPTESEVPIQPSNVVEELEENLLSNISETSVADSIEFIPSNEKKEKMAIENIGTEENISTQSVENTEDTTEENDSFQVKEKTGSEVMGGVTRDTDEELLETVAADPISTASLAASETLDSETMSHLEHVEEVLKAAMVSLKETEGSTVDNESTSSLQKSDMVAGIDPVEVSPKLDTAASMNDNVVKIQGTGRNAPKSGGSWLKPKYSIKELMEKDEKDIISYAAGGLAGAVIRSGTTAFLAANSLLKMATNPELRETAKKSISLASKKGNKFAKMKDAMSVFGTNETSEALSSAANVTSDFVSGSAAVAALGLKVGGNIRKKYDAVKKAEEEARLKAEKEAEKARKAEDERRRIEMERLEEEKRAIEKIEIYLKSERNRVRKQQMDAAVKAIVKIQEELKQEETKIERRYETAIKMVKEKSPAEALAYLEADVNEEDSQMKPELEYFVDKKL